MAYVQLHDGWREHPKVKRLCLLLRDPRAWSYPVALWSWATEYAQDGQLCPRRHPADVEAACDWGGEEGYLLEMLIKVRLVDRHEDGSLWIHDWTDWGGEYFAARQAEAKRKREVRAAAKAAGRPPDVQTCPPDVRQQPQMSAGRPPQNPVCPPDGGECPPDGDALDEIRSDEIRRDERRSGSESLEPAEPASKPTVLLTFPVVGNPEAPEWGLTDDQVGAWSNAFPGLDVLGQAVKAQAWFAANPDRRKTARGMPRFLFSWLSRAVDGARANGHARASPEERLTRNVMRIGNALLGGPR